MRSRFLQERRFVNQPYDPFTNLPFPRADVDGILTGNVRSFSHTHRPILRRGDSALTSSYTQVIL